VQHFLCRRAPCGPLRAGRWRRSIITQGVPVDDPLNRVSIQARDALTPVNIGQGRHSYEQCQDRDGRDGRVAEPDDGRVTARRAGHQLAR
jgi:hypothetical protein